MKIENWFQISFLLWYEEEKSKKIQISIFNKIENWLVLLGHGFYTMQWFSFLFFCLKDIKYIFYWSTHTEYDVSLPFVFAFFYILYIIMIFTDWHIQNVMFLFFLFFFVFEDEDFIDTNRIWFFSSFSISFYIIHIIIIFTVTYRI